MIACFLFKFQVHIDTYLPVIIIIVCLDSKSLRPDQIEKCNNRTKSKFGISI